MAANIIRFENSDIAKSKGQGNIATLTMDLDFTAEPFSSKKANTPTHQLYAKSPKGQDIQIGAIWRNQNRDGKPYSTLNIPALNFRANLGQAAGQDEPEVQAIIPWTPQP